MTVVSQIQNNCRVAIGSDVWIKLSELANKVRGTGRGDSVFVILIKSILNLTVAFQKWYNDKFVAARVMEIVKDKMGSDFLKGMSAQSFHRYIRVAEMILK